MEVMVDPIFFFLILAMGLYGFSLLGAVILGYMLGKGPQPVEPVILEPKPSKPLPAVSKPFARRPSNATERSIDES